MGLGLDSRPDPVQLHGVSEERVHFKSLKEGRVYTKPPSGQPDFNGPVAPPAGCQAEEAAEYLHQDWKRRLKYAVLWGSGKFEGQGVGRDYVWPMGTLLSSTVDRAVTYQRVSGTGGPDCCLSFGKKGDVTSMRYRILGRTGLRVSEIGLGARTMGRNTDDQESLRALNRALDLEINFFDTSDKYQGSEEVVAQVLKTRRQEIILATKGGQIRRNVFEPSPAYLTECLEGSLRRLQIETIDLYQLHQAGPDAMKRGDMWELLDRWKQEGKIRYYGFLWPTA